MNRIQTATRTAVAIGAAGVAVLGFAPTALAAGSDTLTVAGQSAYTYTFNQSPDLQAVAQPNCSVSPTKITLAISGPGVVNPTIASATPDCNNPTTLHPGDNVVDTSSPSWSKGAPAMNGTYTVTLDNEGRTRSVQFTLLIPPAKTTGFSVAPSGTNATFDWTANREPDVVGYVIKNAAGSIVAEPTNACSGASCSSGSVSLGKSVSGHIEKFSIVAVRSCGGATCPNGSVSGKAPATASAKFAAATHPTTSPTPTPTPTKSSGGGGTKTGTSGKGKTGGLSDPGGTTAKHHHKHGGFGSNLLPTVDSGTLPTINVPSLPQTTVGGEPQALGKPGGNLKYPAPEVATKKKVTASSGGITHEISVAVNEKPLWRGIAAAAVLLLIAVHLRTWAGREDYL